MAITDKQEQDVDTAIDTVGAALSATVVKHMTGVGDAPSLRIESAEGITAYTGFNGDDDSARARAWVDSRLAEIKVRYAEKAAAEAAASPKTTGS